MSVELRHGDALLLLHELESESVDAVITDPPYSSGGMHRSDRLQGTGSKYVQTGTITHRPDFEACRPILGFSAQAEYIVWGTRGPTDLGLGFEINDEYLEASGLRLNQMTVGEEAA